MKANVKRVNYDGIVRKVSALENNKGLGEEAAQDAARLMDQFVPFREGFLADPITKPWVVIYNQPYARRQFYGEHFKFSKDRHINAGARWDKKLDKDQLSRELTEYLKRNK